MTKYEIWKDLKQQTRQARKEKNEKRKQITTCEWNNQEKSCIKVIQVQDNTTTEGQTKVEVIERYCDDFNDKSTCIDMTCPFRNKNAEYVLANLKFRAIRADRKRAFWKMFQRSI